MDMQGNRQLGVTQQQAWEALNDPDTLKGCLPGCDRFESTGDDEQAFQWQRHVDSLADFEHHRGTHAAAGAHRDHAE